MNKADEEFRKAVKLESNASDSEKISLGLFHCLLDQGKKREAFAEMDRFMEILECDDYNEIRKEILEKHGSIDNYLNT